MKLNPSRTIRLSRFAVVGGSGIIVNMFFLWFLTEVFQFHYLISSALAIELSILNNFTWNYLWTWQDRKVGTTKAIWLRLAKYNISVLLAAIVNLVILGIFKESFGMHYLFANGIGIAFGFVLNYTLSDRWVYKN